MYDLLLKIFGLLIVCFVCSCSNTRSTDDTPSFLKVDSVEQLQPPFNVDLK